MAMFVRSRRSAAPRSSVDVGELRRQLLVEVVVRRGLLAREQARLAEHEGAGADRHRSGRPSRSPVRSQSSTAGERRIAGTTTTRGRGRVVDRDSRARSAAPVTRTGSRPSATVKRRNGVVALGHSRRPGTPPTAREVDDGRALRDRHGDGDVPRLEGSAGPRRRARQPCLRPPARTAAPALPPGPPSASVAPPARNCLRCIVFPPLVIRQDGPYRSFCRLSTGKPPIPPLRPLESKRLTGSGAG